MTLCASFAANSLSAIIPSVEWNPWAFAISFSEKYWIGFDYFSNARKLLSFTSVEIQCLENNQKSKKETIRIRDDVDIIMTKFWERGRRGGSVMDLSREKTSSWRRSIPSNDAFSFLPLITNRRRKSTSGSTREEIVDGLERSREGNGHLNSGISSRKWMTTRWKEGLSADLTAVFPREDSQRNCQGWKVKPTRSWQVYTQKRAGNNWNQDFLGFSKRYQSRESFSWLLWISRISWWIFSSVGLFAEPIGSLLPFPFSLLYFTHWRRARTIQICSQYPKLSLRNSNDDRNDKWESRWFEMTVSAQYDT